MCPYNYFHLYYHNKCRHLVWDDTCFDTMATFNIHILLGGGSNAAQGDSKLSSTYLFVPVTVHVVLCAKGHQGMTDTPSDLFLRGLLVQGMFANTMQRQWMTSLISSWCECYVVVTNCNQALGLRWSSSIQNTDIIVGNA